MLAIAAHPGGLVRDAMVDRVTVARAGLGLRLDGDDGRPVLEAGDERLRVDLGPDARLDVGVRRPDALAAALRVRRDRARAGDPGPQPVLASLPARARASSGRRSRRGRRARPRRRDRLRREELGRGRACRRSGGGARRTASPSDPDACVAFAGGRARLGPLAAAARDLDRRRARRRRRAHRRAARPAARRGRRRRLARCGPAAPAIASTSRAMRRRRRRTCCRSRAGRAPPPRGRCRRCTSRARCTSALRRGRRLVFAGTSRLAGLERGLGPLSPAPGPRRTMRIDAEPAPGDLTGGPPRG